MRMFDCALMNGTLVDGSGSPPRRANLYVTGDRIARITPEVLPAGIALDASGLVVAPGFIDVHTHSDLSPYCAPGFESYIHQGVTTCLCGNCGGSIVPNGPRDRERRIAARAQNSFRPEWVPEIRATDTASWLEEVDGCCANNIGTFVGHGALREMCMADPRATRPTPAELEAMRSLLRRELEAGAFGLSLGLIYAPGVYSETGELIELAKVAAGFGATVAIHMRSEADHILEAVREVGRIGRESGAHVHISHFKIMSARLWGTADRLLEEAEALMREGIELDFDQYPYLASGTPLATCLPAWSRRLDHGELVSILADPDRFAGLAKEIEADAHFVIGPDRILVTSTGGRCPRYDGLSLGQVSADMGVTPIEAYRRLMLETDCAAWGCYFTMDRGDALRIASREDVAVVSDSTAVDMLSRGMVGVPHPRGFNSFVRFLRINREEGLMPLEKAVYKMTGLPADQMRIEKRGRLMEGYYADLAVFDPDAVADNGTFHNPGVVATGIERVMLNGQWVWTDGRPTGVRSGRGLRRAVR